MTNDELVRRFYEPFNTGETSAFDVILAADWVDVPMAPGQAPGPGGMPDHVAGFRSAFPDYHVHNEDLVVDGDRVAVRSTVTGTHQGPFMGQAPTGRRIAIRTMDVHRIREGRIVTSWHLEDFDGLAAQLRAVDPAPARAWE